MSIVATELIVYASANIPDVDTGTNGGAIDTKRRFVFTQMAANDTVEVISTSASDTGNMHDHRPRGRRHDHHRDRR
jgi:hypothetical protein